MKILLTGSEIKQIGNYYYVIYQSRMIKFNSIEQAIELALSQTNLNKVCHGKLYN